MDKMPTRTPPAKQQGKLTGRVMSIDALRGFAMFWIIGGSKAFASLHDIFRNHTTAWIKLQLSHAEWQGFLFMDLIMPLFLFIVGVVMPFSFDKRIKCIDTRTKIYRHVVKRALILFVLGMIVQGNLLDFDLSRLHIYCNALQAIAVGYLISAIIILNVGFAGQLLRVVALLLLFWALMTFAPVPGHGAGVLTPNENLAIYLDKIVLRRFQDGTACTWILSSITFACTVLLGVMAGHLLRSEKSSKKKVLWLVAAGAGCLVLGLIWNFWFPIIKHLWTSSFVLFSAGLCYLLLAFFYLVIDVLGYRKWAFGFVVIGMNSIVVYVAAMLFDFRQIADIFIGGLAKWTGSWYEFTRAVAGLVIIWLILWWMYRKKSFIKI